MKVEISQKIEREILFPSYWVRRYTHVSSDYYFLLSETSGLKITDGLTQIITPTSMSFDSLVECTPEDIEMMGKWFKSNQAKFNNMMNPAEIKADFITHLSLLNILK